MKRSNIKRKIGVFFLVIVTVFVCFAVQAFAAWDDWHSGYATYTGSGYSGGNARLDPIPSDMEITALNPEDYNSYGVQASLAGAYLEVKGSKGSTVVYVTDKYPEGAPGALDLCPVSFGKVGDISAGKIDISWRVVKAPITGNFTYNFMASDCQWWAAIQVRNHKYPVLKMEYYKDEKWNNMKKEPYNYFIGVNMGTSPLQIRITDIHGQVVTDTLPALAAEVSEAAKDYSVPGNVQFPDVKADAGIVGDINNDGTVNSIDYAQMKSYLTGINGEQPAEDDLWAGDLNGDGTIDSIDYALMKSYLLGKINEFPKK